MNYVIAVYTIVTLFIGSYFLLWSKRRKNLQKEIEYLEQID